LFCAELTMLSMVRHMSGANQLGLYGLSERDPEPVAITNDEFTHIVESIVEVFDDMNPVLEVFEQVIDVVCRYVEVDLATVFGARFPPMLSISSLFPKDTFAQLTSPSSSFCRINLNPIEVYQSTVALTFGT